MTSKDVRFSDYILKSLNFIFTFILNTPSLYENHLKAIFEFQLRDGVLFI